MALAASTLAHVSHTLDIFPPTTTISFLMHHYSQNHPDPVTLIQASLVRASRHGSQI